MGFQDFFGNKKSVASAKAFFLLRICFQRVLLGCDSNLKQARCLFYSRKKRMFFSSIREASPAADPAADENSFQRGISPLFYYLNISFFLQADMFSSMGYDDMV